MATYSFTFDPSSLDDGAYTLEIIATDASVNANVTDTDQIGFTVANGSIPSTITGRPDLLVEIAFGQGPFTSAPDWTNVTADVLMSSQVTITRGATADNPQPTSGVINFTLLDKTRKYDPLNVDGDFYGQLTYGCPCRVSAVFTALPVRIVTSNAIVTNTPIIASGSSQIPLAYGYIDGFQQTYSDPADNYVTIPINAPDALSVLARTSFLPVHPFTVASDTPPHSSAIVTSNPIVSSNPIVGSGSWPDYMRVDVGVIAGDPYNPQERSGTRVKVLCELAGITDDFLSIDPGRTIVEEGAPQESNLLDHFRTIVATEYGRLYQTMAGKIRFVQRRPSGVRFNKPQALFCEVGGLGVPYAALTLDPADRRFLVNRCIRGSQSVKAVMFQDEGSIGRYGAFEDNQTLAFADPQDALDQTEYIVGRFSDPAGRITSLTIKPDRNPAAMYPTILALDIGTQYSVSRTPLGIGSPIVTYVTVEQIVHQLDQTQWTTTIDLGEADTTPYFTADDPGLGLVDAGNRIAY